MSNSPLERLVHAARRTSNGIRIAGFVIAAATVTAVRQEAMSGERLWWQVVGIGIAGLAFSAVTLRWAHRLGALCRAAEREARA